jgi:thioredoxin-like negative regulator of GroEL
MDQRALAARARQLAADAEAGSIERRAALVVAVALAESESVEAARRILGNHPLRRDLRAAAGELLDQLTHTDQGAATPCNPTQRRDPSNRPQSGG